MNKNLESQANTIAAKGNILVVDDDVDICNMIYEYLTNEFYNVELANSGSQAMSVIGQNKPDLVLLDIRLPDIDGLSLLSTLKDKNISVILLTGRTEVADKVTGLELGADDYITKPFHLRELLARIKTVLRRHETHVVKHTDELAGLGRWMIDPKTRCLIHENGTEVHLTSHEYSLLFFLTANSNNCVSREEISNAVYNTNWSPSARRIDTLVYQVRQKLKAHPELPQIKTLHNQGYILIGDVIWTEVSKNSD